jgi:hypothetical protein
MKKLTYGGYVCQICNMEYPAQEWALKCESKPVTKDKGVQVGDIVLITKGVGVGEPAKVIKRLIFSCRWQVGDWEQYWHTAGVHVILRSSSELVTFSRALTFDNYEIVDTRT